MDEELDEFHAHEAMDRVSMMCSIICGELLDHPFIQADAGLREKVEQAVSTLSAVYQTIGEKRFSEKSLTAASLPKEPPNDA